MASDFDKLTPQLIMDSVEKAGFRPTGEYTQLNSYENRVFDLRLEKSAKAISPVERVVGKFYRPGRWSKEALQDEHNFLSDLTREGIPAVAPLQLSNGSTMMLADGFYMSLFPRVLGRNPQEFLPGQLQQVGRTLARIHNVGSTRVAKHRLTLGAKTYGWDTLSRMDQWVYPELWLRYRDAASVICSYLEDELPACEFMRIHGDCHKGNLLHSGDEFFFVDFDDFCNGPVVQDFWMLLSGALDEDDASREQDQICEGYSELRDLPQDDWHLFQPLRGLRIINYAGWIAARWGDASFQRLFPDFTTYNYWLEELTQLEKVARDL